MVEFLCGIAFGLGIACLITAILEWQKVPKRVSRNQVDWILFDKSTHFPQYDWGFLAWGLCLCVGSLVVLL